jgi:hypothetical protein
MAWNPISNGEANDGAYSWNTTSIPCPNIFWINISVYDSIGQKAFAESNFSFMIICPETLPPAISNLQPSDSSAISNNTPTISVDYNDPSGINTGSVRLEVDGVDVTSAPSTTITASGVSYIPDTALTDSVHTIYLEVNDTLGNQATETWSFTVNTSIPPDTTIPIITDQQPPDSSTTNDDSLPISANYSDDTGINTTSVTLKIDGVDVTSSATVTENGITYTPSIPLSEGYHTVYLEVCDNSANQNKANATWSFIVDTTEDEPPLPPKDLMSEYWWLLVVIMVVIIIFLVLFLIMRKKRKDVVAIPIDDEEGVVESPPEGS